MPNIVVNDGHYYVCDKPAYDAVGIVTSHAITFNGETRNFRNRHIEVFSDHPRYDLVNPQCGSQFKHGECIDELINCYNVSFAYEELMNRVIVNIKGSNFTDLLYDKVADVIEDVTKYCPYYIVNDTSVYNGYMGDIEVKVMKFSVTESRPTAMYKALIANVDGVSHVYAFKHTRSGFKSVFAGRSYFVTDKFSRDIITSAKFDKTTFEYPTIHDMMKKDN